ncbi:MAG TPA: HAD family hydrolase [Mobilitalea sp.]|nr:HAD family hydrolase [Mobilitalea sp.]
MNKAIFWDFDGTLVKAPFLWSGSLLKAITTILPGCNITLEDIRRYTKKGFTWDSPEEDYSELIGDKWWEYMLHYFGGIYEKQGVEPELVNKASLLASDYVKDVSRYQLFDDAIATLEGSRAKGYRNYILSNHLPELGEIIAKLGISDYFEGYIISSLVGYDKPRPELFEYAKKLAGYPEICYMIGDNPHADIVGGNAAGMRTILVHKDVLCDADYTVGELNQILSII